MSIVLIQCTRVSLIAHQELDLYIAAIERLVKEEPKSAKLYLKRGELYGEHGDWSAGLADFDQAERLDDTLTHVRLVRSELYLKMGEHAKALTEANAFLDAYPRNVRGHLVRARAQRKLRKFDLADRAYEAAIQLSSSPQPELYLEWHTMFTETKPIRRLEQSLMILDLGMKRLGPLTTLQLAAIKCERMRGAVDAALGRIDALEA